MGSVDGGPVWLEGGRDRCRRGEPRSLAGFYLVSRLLVEVEVKSCHVRSGREGGMGGWGFEGE